MNLFVRVSVGALLLSMLACGTLEISMDRTPTPDAALTGTLGALQAQNSELATKIAAIGQPTEISTPVPPTLPASSSPTPGVLPPAATRITFLTGATVGVVSAPIQAGQSQNYVLQALRAQPMFVYVGSPNNDVTVSIKMQDGTTLLSAAAYQTSWQGSVPQTADYYLTIHGGAITENFSLTVTVPSRIQFAAGAVSAMVSGKTVAGYDLSYTVLASKGQEMRVDLQKPLGQCLPLDLRFHRRPTLSSLGFQPNELSIRAALDARLYHRCRPRSGQCG